MVPLIDIDRPGIAHRVARAAVFLAGPNDDRVPADRRTAKAVARLGVGGAQDGHLAPAVGGGASGAVAVPLVDVGRPGIADRVTRATILTGGPDDDRVPADRHRTAKVVPRLGVGRAQDGHLPPVVSAPLVPLIDVGRPGAPGPGARAAVFNVGSNDDHVLADRHRPAKVIVRLGVGRAQDGHLGG